MPSHILNIFFLFVFHVCSRGLREETKHTEEEMDSEKEEEDSEEEMEASASRPREASLSRQATETEAPALTKSQAKELRRLKKLDYSWLSGVLDS